MVNFDSENSCLSEKQKAFITVAEQLKKYFGPKSDTTYLSIDSNYYGNNSLANKYYIDTMNYDFITINSLALKFFTFDYFFFLPVYDYTNESKNTTIKDSIITCTKGLLVQDLKTNNYFISLKSENNLGRRYTPLLPVLDRGYVPFDSSELTTYFRLNDQ